MVRGWAWLTVADVPPVNAGVLVAGRRSRRAWHNLPQMLTGNRMPTPNSRQMFTARIPCSS